MTPKQQVLKRYPMAYSGRGPGEWWIQMPIEYGIRIIGIGPTPARAWRDALGRMPTRST